MSAYLRIPVRRFGPVWLKIHRRRRLNMPSLTELALGNHSVYRLFRRLTGSARVNREFVERYVRPREGDDVLDVGCGPGDVFELLQEVRYVGIDFSEDYIAAARRRLG